MKKTNKILLILISISITSCGSVKVANGLSTTKRTSSGNGSIAELIEKSDLDSSNKELILANKERAKNHKVPKEINEAVERWIRYFTEQNREWFQRSLTRSEEYEANMKNILISYGVPEDLFYIAFIESGFATRSRSRAGAGGIWQFMPSTAKLYGLNVSRHNDERYAPYKATAAAAAHLRDLYNIYGSWYLAMAAYNAGENRIRNAIIRCRERDFWTLVEKHALPKETMEYIPKFIAASIIGENPEKYGFAYNGPSKGAKEVGEEVKEFLASDNYNHRFSRNAGTTTVATDVHRVRRGDTLISIAKKHRLYVSQIRACNPSLRNRSTIYPGQRLAIRCSQNNRTTTVASKTTKTVSEEKEVPNAYRVRSGDTLWSISKKYDVSMEKIKECNPTLYRHQIFPGQNINLQCSPQEEIPAGSHIVYKVKRGDNLWSISKKYNVSIEDLASWNDMGPRDKIFVGRALKIYTQDNNNQASTYTIKSGDNLSTIAQNNNTSVVELVKCNPDLNQNVLIPGDEISLKCEEQNEVIHIVKKGDNLWNIAKKYNVTIQSLTKWNNLSANDVILEGKRLKVFPSS